MKNNQKGFTLVELLIVIALLGALAVGLLASLDPFEQFKKGDDTGVRNTVSEIQGAVIRYYSIKNSMPWGSTVFATAGVPATDPSVTNFISTIISTGELKTDFLSLAQNQLRNIFVSGTTTTVAVCFQPESKSFRSDPNTKFNDAGSVQGTEMSCGNASATNCYWCVK